MLYVKPLLSYIYFGRFRKVWATARDLMQEAEEAADLTA